MGAQRIQEHCGDKCDTKNLYVCFQCCSPVQIILYIQMEVDISYFLISLDTVDDVDNFHGYFSFLSKLKIQQHIVIISHLSLHNTLLKCLYFWSSLFIFLFDSRMKQKHQQNRQSLCGRKLITTVTLSWVPLTKSSAKTHTHTRLMCYCGALTKDNPILEQDR